jgi:hypothetical protein
VAGEYLALAVESVMGLQLRVLSDAAIAERRAETVDYMVKRHGYAPDMKFTCDDCGVIGPEGKKDCPYVFDPYNTNGDCLAEK